VLVNALVCGCSGDLRSDLCWCGGPGLGVARQLEDCRKLAADRGWLVGDEFVDNDVSAFSGKPRRSYARMLADLESGARDAVIVYNLYRLHRRPWPGRSLVAAAKAAS
jgi:site-specific DNA recombinase